MNENLAYEGEPGFDEQSAADRQNDPGSEVEEGGAPANDAVGHGNGGKARADGGEHEAKGGSGADTDLKQGTSEWDFSAVADVGGDGNEGGDEVGLPAAADGLLVLFDGKVGEHGGGDGESTNEEGEKLAQVRPESGQPKAPARWGDGGGGAAGLVAAAAVVVGGGFVGDGGRSGERSCFSACVKQGAEHPGDGKGEDDSRHGHGQIDEGGGHDDGMRTEDGGDHDEGGDGADGGAARSQRSGQRHGAHGTSGQKRSGRSGEENGAVSTREPALGPIAREPDFERSTDGGSEEKEGQRFREEVEEMMEEKAH